MNRALVLASPILISMLGACGDAPPPPPVQPDRSIIAVVASSAPSAAPADPLGARPIPGMPPAFTPPTPVVYTATNGVTVWLLERHALPVVAITVAIPSGSAADPKGKGGVAFQTANMLDEGAGKYGALELARATDDIGAELHTSANTDFSSVSLFVLKRNLPAGFSRLGDVVARPRFADSEWTRQSALWKNNLKQRASDPQEVAHVLYRTAFYGADHPYGHPVDGSNQSATKVSLSDLKAFYKSQWRPDRAIVVAVGDVTKDELAPLLETSFGSWKAPAGAAPAPVAPPPPQTGPTRVVLVDRPGAPQSVIAVAHAGVAASDPSSPILNRANIAFGGSFTSRLNQDLREEHGWSYGAFSRVLRSRGTGQIIASSSVITEKSSEALKAMLADLTTFAKGGLTDDEVQKTRSQSRADLVGDYEEVQKLAGLLASDAAMGLPPDYEAKAAAARDQASASDLAQLAGTFYNPQGSVVMAVGPKDTLLAAISAAGLPPPQICDADGNALPSVK
jgi:predicted Zn-dependent peptidase